MTYYNNYYGSRGEDEDSSSSYRKRRHHDTNTAHHRSSRQHDEYSSSSHNKRRRHSDDRSHSSREPSRKEWDDEEHHYVINLGESLTPRYKILDIMGEGTFGKVVECWDRELKRYVAVKIIRAIEKYRDAAMIEIEVLEELRKNDPHCQQPCIQLLSWFEFRGHVCMVFKKYGLSIYDFLRKNAYRPFSLHDIRRMGYQLIHAVAFLHSLTLIHTDLKPENVLFVNSDYTTIDSPSGSPLSRSSKSSETSSFRIPKCTDLKLIDFGSATFDAHYHTTVVSTRHYRAPEVLLGLGWTYPCDIWSIGCILIELYTGDALFQTHENREHLAMMERVFGPVPRSMLERADRHSQKYFLRDGRVDFPVDGIDPREREKQLEHLQRVAPLRELVRAGDELFLDLIRSLLRYEPERRLTAHEALQHPFFKGEDGELKLPSIRTIPEGR